MPWSLVRYLLRLHVPVLAAALALGAVGLLAAAFLGRAAAIASLPASTLALAAEVVLLRGLVAVAPAAVLVAGVAVGLGLRRRGELVALEACGVRPRDRLALGLALAAAVALAVAEASRAATPALRGAERDLRGLIALAGADAPSIRLGGREAVVGADEALGGAWRGVRVYVPGPPDRPGDGTLVRAREGVARGEPGRDGVTLELRDVEVLDAGGRVARARAERVRLSGAPSSPTARRRHASLDALWRARADGAPWTPGQVDEELSRRAAELFVILALAFVGFVIAERARSDREPRAWAWAVAALASVQLSLAWTSGTVGPWLAPLALVAAGAVAWRREAR